jgi:hypothetical protein
MASRDLNIGRATLNAFVEDLGLSTETSSYVTASKWLSKGGVEKPLIDWFIRQIKRIVAEEAGSMNT